MSNVVMLAGPGESTHFVYHALQRELTVRALIIEEPVSRGQLLRRRAKKLGLRTVVGQVAFQTLIAPTLRRASRPRIAELKERFGLNDGPIDDSLITRVESANSPAAIERLRELAPSVVVVNGTRILSRNVLRSVPATFLNTHAGITPLFRGVHGGYWSLADGRPESCGVTVHLVNEGIDTGGIVAQALISPERGDSFVTYPYLQYAAALPLLIQAVKDALAGRLTTKEPPAGPSRLWSHPTAFQYLWHRLRQGVR
jgi:folate-dependent phosphoribosylglycinamide formyltransferase PurN